MATLKQIEANRLNAQKSTGPRSVHGKATSSQNALKTGVDAKSLVIKGENPVDLDALRAEYYERFCPRTPEQRHYLDCVIRDDWQLRRLSKVDTEIWDHAMNDAYRLDEDAPLGHVFQMKDTHFVRLQRRIDATHRSYKSALHELQRLQAEQPADADDRSRDRQGAVEPPDRLDPLQPIENTTDFRQIGFVPAPSPEPGGVGSPDPRGAAPPRSGMFSDCDRPPWPVRDHEY